MKKRVVITMFVAALLLVGWAQSAKTAAQCPPVKAKTAQEAALMEHSSNKNGCWTRDKAGTLVFVSNTPPDRNYKSVLGSLHGPSAPAELAPPPIQLAGDAVGRWQITRTLTTPILANWAKGTLTIGAGLEFKFQCDESGVSATFVGPPIPSQPKSCKDEAPSKGFGRCNGWKLTNIGPGYYRIRCGTNEDFLAGTMAVQGGVIKAEAVDRADPYLVYVFEFTGNRLLP